MPKNVPEKAETPRQEAATSVAAKPPIQVALDSFVQEIGSLAITLPLVVNVVDAAASSNLQELARYAKQKCANFRERPGGGFSVRVTPEVYNEYFNRKRKFKTLDLAKITVPRSFLTSLVSHYDAFLGALLRATFYLRPELLNGSEKPLTFKQLTSFDSIDRAREFVVEREVENVIRESHDKQFDWMETKFGLPLRKDLPIWPKFVEVTERRNLFVHCNGVVSAQYIAVCSQHGAALGDCKLGSKLDVPQQYFEDAYEVIFEIGVKLAHVLWRKLRPEDRIEADRDLNSLCLDLIRDERYSLAKTLLAFATGQKTFSSEFIRRTLILNLAQAHKWSGDTKGMKEILSKEDWTASSETFALAIAVLNDDFEEASILMKKISLSGATSPNKGDYREWPIFRQFRTSPEFIAAFAATFGEPYLGSQTAAAEEKVIPEGVNDKPSIQ